jgi:zinc D-Ala-D-Ala dipeptidase
MRYYTPHNFTGDPVDGYRSPMCILTREAAEGLRRAQEEFLEHGYTLKVYDCYRPQRAVNDFVAWAEDPADERMKAEFYPRVDKSVLFADGYIAEKSGHSRGSTMDLTLVSLPAADELPYVPGQPLVDCAAPQQVRFPDNSLDMGTGFDCFDTPAHTLDPRIEGDELKDRLLLKEGLEKQGFVNYDKELRQLRQRVVALHLSARALSGHLLRLPGRPRFADRMIPGYEPNWLFISASCFWPISITRSAGTGSAAGPAN